MDASQPHMGSEHQCLHSTTNATLLASGKYSDLTIRCGSDEYHLHRAIICTKSDFLAVACDGRFKESNEGIIDLPDDDPAIFACLVSFLYTLDYYDGDDDGESSDMKCYDKAKINAYVYAMADKYNIPLLTELACRKFQPHIAKLKDAELALIVDIVFSTTPTSSKLLRNAVVTECLNRLKNLRNDAGFTTVMAKYADFGASLVLELQQRFEKNDGHLRKSIEVNHKVIENMKNTASFRDKELDAANKATRNLQNQVSQLKLEKIRGKQN